MTRATPRVSVLLPVYNACHTLPASVASILRQDYQDFEIVAVDDASTDGSRDLLRAINDPRVRVIENATNRGVAYALNRAIDLARGEYLARMDADDISSPERLSRQVALLDADRSIGVLGTYVRTFGGRARVWKMPTTHEAISLHLLFYSCILHPTVMMRSQAVASLQGPYRENTVPAEDYDLWTRLIHRTRFANIAQVLLDYRLPTARSTAYLKRKSEATEAVRRRFRTEFLAREVGGIDLTDEHFFDALETRYLAACSADRRLGTFLRFQWFLHWVQCGWRSGLRYRDHMFGRSRPFLDTTYIKALLRTWFE